MLPPTDQMWEKGVRTQQCHLSVLLLAYVVIKWWRVNLQACKSTQEPHVSLILFISMNEKERMLHAEECVCVHTRTWRWYTVAMVTVWPVSILSMQKISPLRSLDLTWLSEGDLTVFNETVHSHTDKFHLSFFSSPLSFYFTSREERHIASPLLQSVARSPWLQWQRDKVKGRKWKVNISNVLIYKVIKTKMNVYIQEESQHHVSVASQWETFSKFTFLRTYFQVFFFICFHRMT